MKPEPGLSPLRKRLYRALAAYAVLALAAAASFDGHWRTGLMIFFAALALKSWLHVKKSEMED
jgi:diacylglycerol kinase